LTENNKRIQNDVVPKFQKEDMAVLKKSRGNKFFAINEWVVLFVQMIFLATIVVFGWVMIIEIIRSHYGGFVLIAMIILAWFSQFLVKHR
jgi:hypothetical protein